MFTANARRFVLVERLQTAVCEATVRLFRFVDDRPRLMRVIVRALAVKPVWRFGTTALVTGDRQVREVLERDHDFPLMDDREPKFLTGAFLLGMNRTPQHARERGLLEAAILRTDVSAVAALVRTTSQQQVDAARSIGHIDVVRQLSNPVGERLLRDYFGVSTANDVADDLRILGAMIASPRAMLPAFRNRAASAADRIVTSIASDIRIARAAAVSAQRRDTVLQRMVNAAGRAETTDETVRRDLTGALLPGSALVTRAFATALVQLFRDPHLLAEARESVGNLDRLGRCMLEAMRLHPVFPILPRYSPRATELPGTPYAYRIPAGCNVHAAVAPAMFDRRSPLFAGVDNDPSYARLRTEPELYLHFGGGAHKCLARFIALPELAGMLEAILSLQNPRVGRICYHTDDGITPRELIVRFERGQ